MPRTQNKISTRCSKIMRKSIHSQIMFTSKLSYPITDNLTLYRKTSRWVNRNSKSSSCRYWNRCKSSANFLSAESKYKYHSGVIAPCTLITGIVDPLLFQYVPRYFFCSCFHIYNNYQYINYNTQKSFHIDRHLSPFLLGLFLHLHALFLVLFDLLAESNIWDQIRMLF